jgi:hypothetical protein
MAILGEHRLITVLLFRAKMKLERVMGIEPNEHQIPRFREKYGYHTDLPENPTETQFSQCSPYV